MSGQNRIPFDRYPLAMLLGSFAVVGVLAAIVVLGPGGVFHLLVSFLLPMAVILLVVVGTIGLMVQGVLRCWTAATHCHPRTPAGPLEARASPIQCTGCPLRTPAVPLGARASPIQCTGCL
jgi:hypothetical protein